MATTVTLVNPHRLGVSATHVVLAEIVAVTSAMRRNARWSSTSAYAYARNTAKLSDASMSLRRSSSGPPSSSTSGADLGHGHSVREPPRESDIMAGFESLRRELMQVQDLKEFSMSSLLSPFLDLLKSPLSTGLINAVALSSLHAFFVYGLITPQSVDIRPASVELSDALSRLRFEGGDAATDELVSIRMLLVIEAIMTSAVGAELGDVEVCELLEAVLTICCQMRRGEALRRSAEATMHSLVRTVFSRLSTIDANAAELQLFEEEATEKARAEAEGREGTVTPTSELGHHRSGEITIPSTPNPAASSSPRRYGLLSIRELLRVVVNLLDPTDLTHTDSIRLTALGIITAALSVSIDYIASFSRTLLPIISDKACRFLFQLVASTGTDGHNSDLSVLILERSLRIISMLLGEVKMREKLKLQQELFLSFTLDRLTPLPVPSLSNGNGAPKVQLSVGGKGRHVAVRTSMSSQRSGGGVNSPDPSAPSSQGGAVDEKASATNGEHEGAEPDDDGDESHPPLPPRLAILPARGETRELLLSSLCNLALSQPTFVPDLWVNYDCDLNCEDIFDKLVNFLTTDLASSQSGGSVSQQYTTQLLCLDLLLSFVNHMSQRVDREYPEWDSKKPSADQMFALKAQKKLLLAGTARFNIKPKVGLAFLEEKGLIATSGEKNGAVVASEEVSTTTPRARTIASFLKKSPRLDKKLLGEYISKKENGDILKEFISLYDFRGKSVGEALRDLLESFRLPGEAQQIDRIASTFAECYFATQPDEIKSQDAVYVLTFALIMLNTDQHSPNIRKRMTFEEFQRNLRGVNDKSDFSADYLRKIYDSIRKREIIMPQEHVGQARFDFAWKELMSRSEHSESLVICSTNSFDESIFKMVWKPVVSAIATAFTTFDDELVVQDVIAGFRQCATLAGKFQLPEVFDFLVSSLSRATGLLSDVNAPVTVNYPIVEVDGQTVTVSPLSIRLGTSFRSQLAAVVLFTIANGNGNAIREGWNQIFEMFQTLFLHSLLPTRMLQSEDFLGGVSTIPMQGNATTPIATHGRSDGGLLSTLSSYLMSPGDSAQTIVPEVADRDIEHTMSAIDCIAACRLDELYTQIAHLDSDALNAALRALTELAKRRTMYPLSLLDDNEEHPRGRHEPGPRRQVSYDPASVFLLETMVSVTLQTPDKIEEVWPIIFPHLSGVLSSSMRFSVLLIERVVVGLLRIALILASNPALRDQLYIALDVLNELPAPVLNAVAEQLIAGLSILTRDHREVISSSTEWSLIFALIRDAASHHGASKPAFDLVSSLAASIEKNPPSRLDSLNGLIAILEEFAAVPGRALATRSSRKPPSSQTLSLVNGTIERGVQAIELIYGLKAVIPAAIAQSTGTPPEAWKASWTPLLVALGRQSSSLSPDIRNASLSCMQRILLGPQLVSSREIVDTTHIFFQIIFPLVDDILSQELDDRRGNREMSDTRSRVSTVLCKSFLHLELGPIPANPPSLREIWLIILDFMERLMISGGQQNHLFEAVPETLKNVVLVMNASDMLVRPTPSQPLGNEERDLLWKETAERLEQFLPGFLDDLIPAPTTPMPPPEPVVAEEPAAAAAAPEGPDVATPPPVAETATA